MATTTIYARVPTELKDATDAYAAENGMTLANAVTDLLGRGLEATSSEESVKALEARAAELQQELNQVKPALDAIQERLPQKLGTCECGQELTGGDLLLKGTCPKCRRSLTSALAGADRAGAAVKVDRTDLTPFLAGVGIALAVVLLASGPGK
jgi:antitoxin component of RelBE/YafQ-DinJ toxin-antitoxin module